MSRLGRWALLALAAALGALLSVPALFALGLGGAALELLHWAGLS